MSGVNYTTRLRQLIDKISAQLGKSYAKLFDDTFAFYACKKPNSSVSYRYNHTFMSKNYVTKSERVPLFDRTGEYAIERNAREAFYELYEDVRAGKRTKEDAVEAVMYTIIYTYLVGYTHDSYCDYANLAEGRKLLDVASSKSLLGRGSRFMKHFVFFDAFHDEVTELKYMALEADVRKKSGCNYLLNHLAYIVVYFFTNYKFCIFSEISET